MWCELYYNLSVEIARFDLSVCTCLYVCYVCVCLCAMYEFVYTEALSQMWLFARVKKQPLRGISEDTYILIY